MIGSREKPEGLMSNRHQTVTKTEHQEEVPRKSFAVTQLAMRRAGIEPATYSLGTILRWTRSWFSPLTTLRNLVGILLDRPKKGNGNRNATVTAIRLPRDPWKYEGRDLTPEQRRAAGEIWSWM